MSQATHVIPDSDGSTFLTNLNNALAAINSIHKGNARPSYAVQGTLWIDDGATPWTLNLYDGADDIALGTINATTNAFTPANAATTTGNIVVGPLII